MKQSIAFGISQSNRTLRLNQPAVAGLLIRNKVIDVTEIIHTQIKKERL